MAITGSDHALMFALSGVMRSGASRSNYTGSGVFISIGGVQYGDGRANPNHRVLRESLTITDALNDDPNTCNMRTKGFVPPVGAELVITLGSINNGRREFAGRILQTAQTYWDNPKHDEYAVSAIDYTWGLNVRKVIGRYTGSASAIAAALVAGVPGYSSAGVVPGLPVVDGGITFTHVDVTDALSQLCKRIGASWYVDYHKVVHVFFEQTAEADPLPLTLAHPSARELAIRRDVSQWITRVVVEGGGVRALAPVAPGAPVIPVESAVWYEDAGGIVTAGPQRITYGGRVLGGTGALVGPGAFPSVPVAATLGAAAGGLGPGTYGYALTFETSAGESLVGPVTPINTTSIPPPSTAPKVGTPAVGAGPDPGTHEYAVTFRTATGGESTIGPRVSATTGVTAPPASAPTPTASVGTGLPTPATYDYVVSFVTPIGETTPGPVSSTADTGLLTPPGTPTAAATVGTGLPPGTFEYAVTFLAATGETTIGGISAAVATAGQIANAPAPGLAGTGPNTTEGDLIPGNYYGYAVAWSTAAGQTTHTAQTGLQFTLQARAEGSLSNPAKSSHILVDVPYGPPGVVWAHLYRVNQTVKPGNNPPDFRLLASFSNGVAPGTVRFTDTIADSVIAGAVAGSGTNTTPAAARMTVSNLPKGASGSVVTGRRVYRRQGGGPFGLVYDFANDNVTTSFIDALATPGAGPPGATTAIGTGRITLTNVPTGASASGVTGRRIYRRGAGWGWILVLTINDNTTTTIVDAVPPASAPGPPVASTAYASQLPLTDIPLGGPLVTTRSIYRTAANSPNLRLLVNIGDNTTTTWLDQYADTSLQPGGPPATGTAAASAVQVSAISVSPASAGVIARGLYRTGANGAALRKLVRIADNVTTTYLDTAADAALGAPPPTSDLSGLKQPEGAVNAGATVIPVSGTGWARAAGGWVVIGNGQQVIRYGGISGNTLIGIPSTGDGAITATIGYNSSITLAAMLTGIPASGAGALVERVLANDDVNLIAIRTDTAGAAALAAYIGGDGIQEEFVQDRRLSLAEALARADAVLALRGALGLAITYTARDLNAHSGRTLVVNLGAPFNVAGVLLIQRSTGSYAMAGQLPTYTVEASSERYSFEDLLRMARLTRGT